MIMYFEIMPRRNKMKHGYDFLPISSINGMKHSHDVKGRDKTLFLDSKKNKHVYMSVQPPTYKLEYIIDSATIDLDKYNLA